MVLPLLILSLMTLYLPPSQSKTATTTTRRMGPRIVGGTDAAPNQFPFFAYWDQGCGASMISQDLFLSAAHCYIDGNYGRMWLGSVDYQKGKAYDVVEVWYHPLFDGDFYSAPKYDFLIARVNQSIPASVATPVTLNREANVPAYTGEPLVVIGFGSLDEGGDDYPDVLQQVEIPFLETEPVCNQLWDGAIGEMEMCTVHPDGGKDSCFGDSGGPILTLPELYQVGVVSWGDGCGQPDAPAVAARVSAVAESWIYPHICLHSKDPPDYCQDLSVDLPLSLRLDLVSNSNMPWQSQNISIGLYQVTPPEVLYLVEDGITVINNLPSPTATSRKKDDKKKDQEEFITSLYFDNLRPGLYYFSIAQEVRDMLQVGTFQRVRVIQGDHHDPNNDNNNNDNTFSETSDSTILEHAWVDLDGASFQGFSNQYIDLHSSWALAEVQPPVTVQLLGPLMEVTIDVFYDKAPNETAWELRDLLTDTVLLEIPFGNITRHGFVDYSVDVPLGTSLQFTVWDKAGDGICCDEGKGWIEIWAGYGRIWEFDGVFEDEFAFQFQV